MGHCALCYRLVFSDVQTLYTLRSSPTGRKASTHSLELSLAGVTVDEDGKVVVTETERTSAPNVYAIGDVAKVYACVRRKIHTCLHVNIQSFSHCAI